MKKMIVALVAVSFAIAAFAQQSFTNSETLARAFLQKTVDHYVGYASGQQYNAVKGSWENTMMQFVMNKSLYITNLSVNGTNIPVTKPLPGLRIPKTGFRSFGVWIEARDAHDGVAASGRYESETQYPGTPISVEMWPQLPTFIVPFDPGTNDTDDLQLTFDGAYNWGYMYEDQLHAYVIQLFGAGPTDLAYEIRNRSGVLLQHGTVPAFENGADPSDTTTVGLTQPAGVIGFDLSPRSYQYRNDVKFDAQVVRNDVVAKAVVFNVSGIKGNRLYIYMNGGPSRLVEVQLPTTHGEMPQIPLVLVNKDERGISQVTSSGMDSAVVTIFPTGKEDTIPYIYMQTW